jgi:hypothetical protein
VIPETPGMASSADIRDKLRQDREQDEQQLRRTLGLPTGRRSSDRLIRDQLRETKAELGRHQDIVARLRGLVDRWINAADEMAAQRDHLAREVLRLQHERTLVSEDLETARVNASRKSEQIVALRKCLGDLQLVAAPRELFKHRVDRGPLDAGVRGELVNGRLYVTAWLRLGRHYKGWIQSL